MSLLLASAAELGASSSTLVNLGSLAACLSVVWLALSIVGWFRPKDSYATKAELAELRGEFRALDNTIQRGFKDIERAIGRLEGKSGAQ